MVEKKGSLKAKSVLDGKALAIRNTDAMYWRTSGREMAPVVKTKRTWHLEKDSMVTCLLSSDT